jgi:hypothetical protein
MAATTVTIGGNGELFVGEDKIFDFECVDDPSAESPLPVNITGWDILFDVRLKDTSPDPAILSKTASIIGVFNADRTLNTQRAIVAVSDTEMNLFKAKTYRHSWKRMDDGVETVLSRGDFAPEKATAP